MNDAAIVAVVLAGVPIHAAIAAALGVFASNPLEVEPQRRIRPGFVSLYFLVASLYAYGIYATSAWERLALAILSGTLALALWQKARDRLPFLLDPVAAPPPRVSLADGVIAAQIFFVAQGLFFFVRMRIAERGEGPAPLTDFEALAIAFAAAGALTYGAVRLAYWRGKVTGVPRAFGPGAARAAGWGLASGALAAAGASAYLFGAERFGLAPGAIERYQAAAFAAEALPWLLLLTVVAAPIFEEFIFRGLIFGGLRRSHGLLFSALASVAIFAIVHPPFAVVPVFGLGVCSALAYERTGLLLAPMVAHAVYNAALVARALLQSP